MYLGTMVSKHQKHLSYHYYSLATIYNLPRIYKNNRIYRHLGFPINVLWVIDLLNIDMSPSSSGMTMMRKKAPKEYAKRAGERVKA